MLAEPFWAELAEHLLVPDFMALEPPSLPLPIPLLLAGDSRSKRLMKMSRSGKTKQTPIIILSARVEEYDKLHGFEMGADDYVTKPFSPAELTARVDALYRRAGGEDPVQTGELRQPPFLLNTRNRTLEKNGQRIKLTQVEYSIMRVFMENPGKALSREEILDMVWGRDYFGELKIVDVNIRRLRLKIEDNVQNPAYITTVWGYGYKWGL